VNVFQKIGSAVPILLLTLLPVLGQNPTTSAEIDLEAQTAYFFKTDGRFWLRQFRAAATDTSLREVHSKFLRRNEAITRACTGKLSMRRGNTIVADADADMRVPPGGKFIPAPMHYFMRFNGADGMHAGYLPGYPASHGCVRMPEEYAVALFNSVSVGTPVTVFGRTGWPLFRKIAVHDAETTSWICRPAFRFIV